MAFGSFREPMPEDDDAQNNPMVPEPEAQQPANTVTPLLYMSNDDTYKPIAPLGVRTTDVWNNAQATLIFPRSRSRATVDTSRLVPFNEALRDETHGQVYLVDDWDQVDFSVFKGCVGPKICGKYQYGVYHNWNTCPFKKEGHRYCGKVGHGGFRCKHGGNRLVPSLKDTLAPSLRNKVANF